MINQLICGEKGRKTKHIISEAVKLRQSSNGSMYLYIEIPMMMKMKVTIIYMQWESEGTH